MLAVYEEERTRDPALPAIDYDAVVAPSASGAHHEGRTEPQVNGHRQNERSVARTPIVEECLYSGGRMRRLRSRKKIGTPRTRS